MYIYMYMYQGGIFLTRSRLDTDKQNTVSDKSADTANFTTRLTWHGRMTGMTRLTRHR